MQCDVTQYAEVENAGNAARNHFGSLDILVNNAGTIEPISRLEDTNPDEWRTVVDVNLMGVYHGLRAAYWAMKSDSGKSDSGKSNGRKSKDGGMIINISSGAASGALGGWSHYCATKAAVLSLTRCAHKEWNAQGVDVVGLSPATVATDMQTAIKDSGINPVSELDWSQHISPEWVGEAIAWFASEAGGKYDGGDFSLKSEEEFRAAGLL